MRIETPITVEDLSEMGTSARRELVRAVNLHNGLVRALREARVAIMDEYGEPCRHLEKIDAVLALVGQRPSAAERTPTRNDGLTVYTRPALSYNDGFTRTISRDVALQWKRLGAVVTPDPEAS